MVDMTKRERTGSLDRDENASTPTSVSSESVQNMSDIREHRPTVSGGAPSSQELDVSDINLSVDLMDQDENSGLERELEHLGVDDDLKASIRTMTPNTQREIINDIVRTRQVPPLILGGAQMESPFEPTPPRDSQGPGSVRMDFTTGVLRNAIEMYDLIGPILTRFDGANAEEGEEAPPSGSGFVWDSRQMSMLLSRMPIFQEVQQLLTMQHMGLDRDIDDMSYEELLALEERIGNVSKGVSSDKEMISCMRRLSRPPTEGSCVICLDAFKGEEPEEPAPSDGGHSREDGASERKNDGGASPVVPRPCVCMKNCGHIFHLNCIKQWLQMDKRCPVCNQEVIIASSES
ncbi:unnamed protein product [Phytomonas sp. EM1]|nr:unnamed protein product [Phytomonas sp. EM1]|eukprot:CCW65060.1 unnamed protein product [Phytomonas sp. isolate EM1]